MTPQAKTIDKEDPAYRSDAPACLRGASLFSALCDTDILCFQNAARTRLYKKGKVLYCEGEGAEFFYIICGGWIKLFHTMPEGEEVIVDMLTIGHMVGENAIFEYDKHTSSAQVIEDVQLISIPTLLLKQQIHQNPKVALAMLTSMSRHHRHHYGQIALNAMQNAPQRIGCFLLRLCPRDQKKKAVFHLPYDKALIASTLGMKGATFSRALNILRKKTDIRISGTCIEIDSVERLVGFVYGPLAAKYMPEEM